MLFFAWSLLLDAVTRARRRRLIAALSHFVQSRDVSDYTLICQRSSHTVLLLDEEDLCAPVRKAPSEPVLDSGDEGREVLYRNEEKEIAAKREKIILRVSDWRPVVSSTSCNLDGEEMGRSDQLVYFIARTASCRRQLPSHTSAADPSSSRAPMQAHFDELVDGRSGLLSTLAAHLARSKRDPSIQLFSASLDNFFELLFRWSEGDVMYTSDSGACMPLDAMISIKLPNEALREVVPQENIMGQTLSTISTSSNASSSSSMPESTPTHLSTRGQLIRSYCQLDEFSQSQRTLSLTPHTMLEALYLRDLRELFDESGSYSAPSTQFRTTTQPWRTQDYFERGTPGRNSWLSTCTSGRYRSDSCLNRPPAEFQSPQPPASVARQWLSPSFGRTSIITSDYESVDGRPFDRNALLRNSAPPGDHHHRQSSFTLPVSYNLPPRVQRSRDQGRGERSNGGEVLIVTAPPIPSTASTLVPNYFRQLRNERGRVSSSSVASSRNTRDDDAFATKGVPDKLAINMESPPLRSPTQTASTATLPAAITNTNNGSLNPSTPTLADGITRLRLNCRSTLPPLSRSSRTQVPAHRHRPAMSSEGAALVLEACSVRFADEDDNVEEANDGCEVENTAPPTRIPMRDSSYTSNEFMTARYVSRKRFNSLMPGGEMHRLLAQRTLQRQMKDSSAGEVLDESDESRSERISNAASALRRRSLSPLTMSMLEKYSGLNLEQRLNSPLTVGLLPTDRIWGRRATIQGRYRRYHSQTRRQSMLCTVRGEGKDLPSGQENGEAKAEDAAVAAPPIVEPKAKPPSVLVYTGNKTELFNRISSSLRCVLPLDTYTIKHLSTNALELHPWMDQSCSCLLVADTKTLSDRAWNQLQAYFANSGKMIFLCQNSLLASLSGCTSLKKQASLLKNAFCVNRAASFALGKEFEHFLKRAMKSLAKNKEINEVFHAKDLVGGEGYSVVLFKKQDQPFLLYMQNSKHHASALFSDATTDQLLRMDAGGSLMSDALARLGFDVTPPAGADSATAATGYSPPSLTPAYMICEKDRLILDIKGLSYGIPVSGGDDLHLHFQSTSRIAEGKSLPPSTPSLLPIEIRRRKSGLSDLVARSEFDAEKYFDSLSTKSLGKVLVYVPVCETTLNVSRSLSIALPDFDGILTVAGCQTKGRGRGGNEWISPKGCMMFTFNFNIPLESELGQAISFVQHITAVAVVEAVIALSGDDEFPMKIKWPNDIYYERRYKMGGVLVNATVRKDQFQCLISAGLNVANSKPNGCINDLLSPDAEKLLSVEEMLATTMNKFEEYVNVFEKQGRQEFLKTYYDHWMHTKEEVSVLHADVNAKEKVMIRGLDAYGFLEVRSRKSGSLFSVQDDGNTFDMLRGLIHPKN